MRAQTKAKRRIRVIGFFSGVIGELKKVGWPSRDEAIRLTAIVLVVTTVIALILWGVDTLFTELIDMLLLD
ncbi:MAG: preprotein translocase subunit SecE [Dehalococcoidia bacterium]